MMIVFVVGSTNMNDERVFLVDQSGGDHWESEMKVDIYDPIINVGSLMSIEYDRQ